MSSLACLLLAPYNSSCNLFILGLMDFNFATVTSSSVFSLSSKAFWSLIFWACVSTIILLCSSSCSFFIRAICPSKLAFARRPFILFLKAPTVETPLSSSCIRTFNLISCSCITRVSLYTGSMLSSPTT